jgi:hypothetical protein
MRTKERTMRILAATTCLIASAAIALADVPVDVACTIETYGSFPTGDAWTGSAESDDADPGTLTGTGEWVHELPDGRTFRGDVENVRCRANGGIVGNVAGHGRIHGAPRNTDDPGLGIGHCIGIGHEGRHLQDGICDLLGPPGATTYEFVIGARDDGDIDSLSFQLRDEEGTTVYTAGGLVTDNGEVVILPKQ